MLYDILLYSNLLYGNLLYDILLIYASIFLSCWSDDSDCCVDLAGSTAPPSPRLPLPIHEQQQAKQAQQQHNPMMNGSNTHFIIRRTNANMYGV